MANGSEEKEAGLHAWERKLLILAFGAWAGVLAIYGQQAVDRMDRLTMLMEQDRKERDLQMNQMDRRILLIEHEQKQFRRLILTPNGRGTSDE